MPEGGTRSETLRAGKPFAIGGVTLLPIERVVIRVNRGHGRVWFAAIKEPYALALRDAGGIRAVDVDANAVPLEHLREKVPGFEAVLAAM